VSLAEDPSHRVVLVVILSRRVDGEVLRLVLSIAGGVETEARLVKPASPGSAASFSDTLGTPPSVCQRSLVAPPIARGMVFSALTVEAQGGHRRRAHQLPPDLMHPLW
jgi:hypothetical protein